MGDFYVQYPEHLCCCFCYTPLALCAPQAAVELPSLLCVLHCHLSLCPQSKKLPFYVPTLSKSRHSLPIASDFAWVLIIIGDLPLS